MRHWNDETYIGPEIIRELDPKYLLLRKTELEKQRGIEAPPVENKQQAMAIKDKILEKIKSGES